MHFVYQYATANFSQKAAPSRPSTPQNRRSGALTSPVRDVTSGARKRAPAINNCCTNRIENGRWPLSGPWLRTEMWVTENKLSASFDGERPGGQLKIQMHTMAAEERVEDLLGSKICSFAD